MSQQAIAHKPEKDLAYNAVFQIELPCLWTQIFGKSKPKCVQNFTTKVICQCFSMLYEGQIEGQINMGSNNDNTNTGASDCQCSTTTVQEWTCVMVTCAENLLVLLVQFTFILFMCAHKIS